MALRDSRQGQAFGQILPDESVGVLIGALLPAVVGRGEVEAHRIDGCDLGVPMELGPVVSRDRGDALGMRREQLEQGAGGFGGRPRGHLADEDVAGFAFAGLQ